MSYEVVGDPDEIRSFSDHLSDYCQSTLDSLRVIRNRLVEMESNQTWADARYQQYKNDFDEQSSRLEGSLRVMEEEHVPHLRALVEKLRAYHEE
jgi:hypothetical protein